MVADSENQSWLHNDHYTKILKPIIVIIVKKKEWSTVFVTSTYHNHS